MTRKNEPTALAGDGADKMNEPFGAYLRRERELRFIELDEISKSTMIGMRFLKAIENDDFESLPHDTFIRGFLRSYAKYVGLDQDEVITNYEHYYKAVEKEEPAEKVVQKTKTNYPMNSKLVGGILATLLVGGILVYLAVTKVEEASAPAETTKEEAVSTTEGAYQAAVPLVQESLLQEPGVQEPGVQEPGVREPGVRPQDLPDVPVEKPMPVTPPVEEVSKKVVETPAVSSQEPVSAEIKTPEAAQSSDALMMGETTGLELSVKAKKDSWILYQLDNGVDSDIILKEGETKKLSATSKIVLTVGNAAGVELVLNGKPVPALGKEGQVVRGLVFEVKDVTKKEN